MILCARVQRQHRHYCNHRMNVVVRQNCEYCPEKKRRIKKSSKVHNCHDCIIAYHKSLCLSLPLPRTVCSVRSVRNERAEPTQIFVCICARLNVRHFEIFRSFLFLSLLYTRIRFGNQSHCRLHLVCYSVSKIKPNEIKTNQCDDMIPHASPLR